MPLILYSANTWLAYKISQIYYGDLHYVWCTPVFDGNSVARREGCPPPTSCPADIAHNLWAEVRSGDRHSAKIKENRIGILNGATRKREAGMISEDQEREIAGIVELAETNDFRPLLYLLPYASVSALARPVAAKDKAHPLAEEYIIEALPRSCFDIIEIHRT